MFYYKNYLKPKALVTIFVMVDRGDGFAGIYVYVQFVLILYHSQ